jgi:hypothetical protein
MASCDLQDIGNICNCTILLRSSNRKEINQDVNTETPMPLVMQVEGRELHNYVTAIHNFADAVKLLKALFHYKEISIGGESIWRFVRMSDDAMEALVQNRVIGFHPGLPAIP